MGFWLLAKATSACSPSLCTRPRPHPTPCSTEGNQGGLCPTARILDSGGPMVGLAWAPGTGRAWRGEAGPQWPLRTLPGSSALGATQIHPIPDHTLWHLPLAFASHSRSLHLAPQSLGSSSRVDKSKAVPCEGWKPAGLLWHSCTQCLTGPVCAPGPLLSQGQSRLAYPESTPSLPSSRPG